MSIDINIFVVCFREVSVYWASSSLCDGHVRIELCVSFLKGTHRMLRYFIQKLLDSNWIIYLVLSKEETILKGATSDNGSRKTLPSTWNFYSMMQSQYLLISSLPPEVKGNIPEIELRIVIKLLFILAHCYSNHLNIYADYRYILLYVYSNTIDDLDQKQSNICRIFLLLASCGYWWKPNLSLLILFPLLIYAMERLWSDYKSYWKFHVKIGCLLYLIIVLARRSQTASGTL